ncbi:hypothetical protein [Halobaculum limi]|uniref:hypothetical protein n=1 Tax=Halobaculum limi TaxID=3031916 RepID=UPI002405A055|nr:hypothetical protein [Halobaculum sp. YSMS11]
MNDDFITQAIAEDRYLKALRLIDRFEMEIEGELKRVAEEFISGTESLFADGVSRRFKFARDSGAVLAHARVNTGMNRVASAESGADTLTLNITLRWLDPAEYGISHVDGALCVAGYKINGATSEDHTRVKQYTEESDTEIQFCRDAYNNAPGLIYVPVETAEDIREGFELLKKHFWDYGAEYGVDPDSVE